MTYRIHEIPGRVRIRSPWLKKQTALLDSIRHFLLGLDGVERVWIRPLTGSVLVHFTPERLDVWDIFQGLANRGLLLRRRRPPRPPRLTLIAG